MAKLEKSITINAPAEKVFGYINVPTNLPEVWPSMVEAKDVERLSNGGTRFRYVYKMAGMRLEGSNEDVEWVANERMVSESRGGIESTSVWTFEPEESGTRVTAAMDYTVPIPVLGKLAERVVLGMNEREAETLLANLKARMES